MATYEPRLKTKFRTEIRKNLLEKFSYSSTMQVPQLKKICLNQGLGDAVADKKII